MANAAAAAQTTRTGIALSDDQNAAKNDIVRWYMAGEQQEYYLAGYAGTGKSTVVQDVLQELAGRAKCRNVLIGTYTGKAAHVLRQKGNDQAQTIHSMIYSVFPDEETGKPIFKLDPNAPASGADLIVLDECSMVPDWMADDLRSFRKPILIIGDPGQLPPVKGAGAFTDRKPEWFFAEIHRQAADDPIIRLSTLARQGQPIPYGRFGDRARVIPADTQSLPYVSDPDTQVICGVHKNRWRTTQMIRRTYGYEGRQPQAGEKLLVCRNNHEEGFFNGMTAVLKDDPKKAAYPPGAIDLRVQIEDTGRTLDTTVHPYLFDAHFTGDASLPFLPKGTKVDHFDWGYVLTCHKAQGSQWPRVTVIDDSFAFGRQDPTMAHRWLYTAITRAEAELTLIRRG